MANVDMCKHEWPGTGCPKCRMDERTRTAIQDSITAWEHKLAADDPTDVNLGTHACPLCEEFYRPFEDDPCFGCPIFKRTNQDCCRGTPYDEAHVAFMGWSAAMLDPAASVEAVIHYRDQWRVAAQREVDFLRSLLPENANG